MRSNEKFSFVRSSRTFLLISLIITVIGIVGVGIRGMNYGIDFSSGSAIDITMTGTADKSKIDSFLAGQKLGDYTLVTSENRASIRFKEALNETQEKKFKADFGNQVDKKADYEVNIVDPEIAKEQQRSALIGMSVACLLIVGYVSIRFEWRFAIAAILSLVYNAFFVIAVFSVFGIEVNLPFILAVLTIIGYSINDTVVIFDRIRENLRFAKIKTNEDIEVLVDNSIRQTLARSINTVITVLIAAVCLYILGGDAIKHFSLAMIIGLVSGAYSSIFIASPIWLYFKKKEPRKSSAKASNAPKPNAP